MICVPVHGLMIGLPPESVSPAPRYSLKLPPLAEFGRNRRSGHSTLLLPVLFPRKEEESFVVPVIQVRDANRPAHGASVIVLAVERRVKDSPLGWSKVLGMQDVVVAPHICIQVFVPEKLIESSVIVVGPTFGVKTFNASRGAAELRGHGRGQDLKFAQGFH